MASINYAHKEIISKIVYYGPGLSGKTTNLQFVFKKIPAETRGELISLATDADRTLYFDFLPLNIGTIQGFATKFQLYTVPGQVYYNATRKLVLRGVDGLVFVADSQAEKLDENIESLQNLKDNLIEYGYDIDLIPMAIQYNKRDLPSAMSIEELEKALNPAGWPFFEAVASSGEGVFKTLKAISKMVLEQIQKNKMGAPKAVIPQKPKQELVASVAPGKAAETVQSVNQTSNTVQPPTPPVEDLKSSETVSSAVETEEASRETVENEPEQKVAGIVKDSETLANVVVSDSQKLPDQEDEAVDEQDLEETTERAVLAGDTSTNGTDKNIEAEKENESEQTAQGDEDSLPEPIYGTLSNDDGFDEEATQISDLNLKNPLSLDKPRMAESRKVKNKNRKFSLFGLFKKSRK